MAETPERPPSVDAVARSLAGSGLPHPLCVDAARAAIAAGDPASAAARAASLKRALLQPVVNATGVLLHTNLGRAPLGVSLPEGYANLELDLDSGRRGSRQATVAPLVARLCGAEAALVVNNNAAAVLVALAALAAGRQVAVSRGEAVEIGGGFRVPEVMAQSGCRLVDVGTTNRTRLADYRRAVDAPGADVALLLKVHPSNYRVEGFTEAVPVGSLATLGVPVIADVGSGLLDSSCPWLPGGPPPWLAGEPAARQTLEGGAALVTFSGDKLLGGPQCGIIAGRSSLVEACSRHPLMRALRPGGLVLAALQQVLLAYLRRDLDALPFWRLVSLPVSSLRARADAVVAAARWGTSCPLEGLPGAGSLPGTTVPSWGVTLDGDLSGVLRAADPPVIARVSDGRTTLDLRTVAPEDDAHLVGLLSLARTRPD